VMMLTLVVAIPSAAGDAGAPPLPESMLTLTTTVRSSCLWVDPWSVPPSATVECQGSAANPQTRAAAI
jgi:hypothetical protein